MITIPAVPITFPDGTTGVQPATQPPDDAIWTTCDGTTYTVYEPGDTLPPLPTGDAS